MEQIRKEAVALKAVGAPNRLKLTSISFKGKGHITDPERMDEVLAHLEADWTSTLNDEPVEVRCLEYGRLGAGKGRKTIGLTPDQYMCLGCPLELDEFPIREYRAAGSSRPHSDVLIE